jgi:betaine-homocysteine S-methyltransferase
LAREVADEFPGTLVAGNVSNSTTWDPEDEDSQKQVEANIREQVQWAKEEGADFIVGETFGFLEEALVACRVIKEAGLEAVVTLSINGTGKMGEGQNALEACLTLEEAGADVVGFNCTRGPQTMYTILEEVAKSEKVKVPLAALPVMYRTTAQNPTMQSLTNPQLCYMDLELHLCTRMEAFNFAQYAAQLPGVKYLGVCCGASPYHLRAMAMAVGVDCEAAKYKPDLSQHFALKDDDDVQKKQFFS